MNTYSNVSEYYSDYKLLLTSLGFEFNYDSSGNVASYNKDASYIFEVLYLVLNIALFYYYNFMAPKPNIIECIGYINHSEFLKTYMSYYNVLFVLLFFDMVFARNVCQFIVLGISSFFPLQLITPF